MQTTIFPSVTKGQINAIASKSVAHRLLICAAFADKSSTIECAQTNDDIDATINCLCALGASITRNETFFEVTPIKPVSTKAVLPCSESGSTLRFILPICAMLGGEFTFDMKGRLPQRPLSPLKELLEENGITFIRPTESQLTIKGKLSANTLEIAGNISSQFITGLLLALTITGKEATLKITKKLESAPYVEITLDALSQFGVSVERTDDTFKILQNSTLTAPDDVRVEGDWSNAAFPLALGIIGKSPIYVNRLSKNSKQGDKEIINILKAFGGSVKECDDGYISEPSSLHGISVDASQIPDLIPIIATVATVAKGQTVIYNASRLRLKESDRLLSVSTVLTDLGADVTQTEDGLIINGKDSLEGGCVSSFGDHRIAMSLSVASVVCKSNVILEGSEATQKSYPSFWDDMRVLGLNFEQKH